MYVFCASLPSFLRFYLGSRREEPINFFRTVETKSTQLLPKETDSEYSSAVGHRTTRCRIKDLIQCALSGIGSLLRKGHMNLYMR